jgi:hypothetical protein
MENVYLQLEENDFLCHRGSPEYPRPRFTMQYATWKLTSISTNHPAEAHRSNATDRQLNSTNRRRQVHWS